MITEKEEQATLLSPTKKDYYQIWNELLELAGKISERWTPESTNESDPGVILLKVLTACADKLNYNIDKNILEAFMPSAAQEESMRKLCDMMGYSMKYYRSATTDITVSYIGDTALSGTLEMPKYTMFTDSDNEIQYVTTRSVSFDSANITNVIPAIEGKINTCEEENDGIVTLNNIDDNYRYYLPVYQVAENGIFIHNYVEGESVEGDEWEQKDNLNCQALENKFYKFGYDSKQQMPYIQFPEDISSLIENGLIIEYITTNGVNGNISKGTLTTFQLPTGWDSTESTTYNTTGTAISLDSFSVYNASATTNGYDKESLNSAYNGFKKTVGTFDTLVTCRDYMNKIYNLTVSETDTTALVSNDIVADIRDDINSSYTLCTFDEFGINYVDKAKTKEVTKTDKNGNSYTIDEDLINNFDLVLYPFKNILDNSSKINYQSSFNYSETNYSEITSGIKEYKTISHNIKLPTSLFDDKTDPIICIKNYLKLNAQITTTAKVNSAEQSSIKKNIYTAIYKKFNARELDFGETIDKTAILEVMQDADVRIKYISLDEPTLLTKICTYNKSSASTIEYNIASTSDDTGKELYNKLALRNILAGRLAIFNYNTDFTPSITESGSTIYESTSDKQIEYLEPVLTINNTTDISESNPFTLQANQIVQFRAPKFKSIITYPTYVNYFIHLENNTITRAIPATFQTLYDFMTYNNGEKFKAFMDYTYSGSDPEEITYDEFSSYIELYGYGFTRTGTGKTGAPYVYTAITEYPSEGTAYGFKLNSEIKFAKVFTWVKTIETAYSGEEKSYLSGLYKSLGVDTTRTIGRMIDANQVKYQLCSVYNTSQYPFTSYFVQKTHEDDDETNYTYTKDGFGRDAVYQSLTADSEYKLKDGEYLCINYTDSSTSVDSDTSTTSTDSTVVNTYYGPGNIIKPNFALIDSVKKKESGSSYPKTDGFSFSEVKIDGMYQLGSDEQIEIRKQDITYIYNNSTNTNNAIKVYFKLNNEVEDKNDAGYVTFLDNGESRQLAEGEYLWYTDVNQTILYYYGNGYVITNKTGGTIKKKADASTITTEKILEEGIDAIPWITISGLTCTIDSSTSKPDSNSKYIEADNYQYITLTDTDKIKTIGTIDENAITNTWKSLPENPDVIYVCDDTEAALPQISINNSTRWQVRSKLALNFGPSQTQTLTSSSSTTTTNYTETVKINYSKGNSIPISNKSIKANYQITSTDDKVQTLYTFETDDGEYALMDDFKINSFTENTLCTYESDGTTPKINVGNMDNYYTKIPFANSVQNKKWTEIYCSVPENNYGIILIYYNSKTTAIDDLISIKANSNISIFNNNESWWTGYTAADYALTIEQPSNWKVYYTRTGEGSETNPYVYTVVSIWPTDGWKENTYYDANKELTTSQPTDWGTTWYTNYYTLSSGSYIVLTKMSEWVKDTYYTNTAPYRLKPNALNIIKFNYGWSTDSKLEIFAGKDTDDTIIIGPYRLVKITSDNTYGINKDLLQYYITDETLNDSGVQLLNDIAKLDTDHAFYYNAIIDPGVELNINTYKGENLASSEVWYDYNNVNNKFVISEIDADYMTNGIVFSSSSQKLY